MSIYTPNQVNDSNGGKVNFSFANMQMVTSKAGLDNAVYIGFSRPNIDASDPAWLISKQTFDSAGDTVHIQHAVDGLSQIAKYNQVWDNSTFVEIASVNKAAICEVVTEVAHGLVNGDLIEIVNCNMAEINGNGYGDVMFTVKVFNPTTFTLVDPKNNQDLNSSGFVNLGVEGQIYHRTYSRLNYA